MSSPSNVETTPSSSSTPSQTQVLNTDPAISGKLTLGEDSVGFEVPNTMIPGRKTTTLAEQMTQEKVRERVANDAPITPEEKKRYNGYVQEENLSHQFKEGIGQRLEEACDTFDQPANSSSLGGLYSASSDDNKEMIQAEGNSLGESSVMSIQELKDFLLDSKFEKALNEHKLLEGAY